MEPVAQNNYQTNRHRSVPLRPSEKIRKVENQNVVHCLVLMCSSML